MQHGTKTKRINVSAFIRYDKSMMNWRGLWVNRQCEHCEEELFDTGLFCPSCQQEIHRHLYPVVTQSEGYFVISLYHYKGIIRKLLQRMKFQEGRYISRHFSEDVVRFLHVNEMAPECVSFIPMHSTKRRVRGFDQAKDLSVEVAGRLKRPHHTLLRRIRSTRSLYKLSAKERRAEVEQAFQATLQSDERLWLVLDDILTTGSTIGEAAVTLKEADIPQVLFLVIAR